MVLRTFSSEQDVSNDAIALAENVYQQVRRGEKIPNELLFKAISVSAYLHNNSHTPSEKQKWYKIWDEVRNEAVKSNIKLMLTCFKDRDYSDDVYYGAALTTLYRLVDGFNPYKGYKFSSYAKRSIYKSLSGRYKQERIFKKRNLSQPFGFKEGQHGSDGEYERLEDDPHWEDPAWSEITEEHVIKKKLIRRVKKEVSKLPSWQRHVLTMLFLSKEPLNCVQIAKQFGVTKQSPQAACDRAIKQLKKRLCPSPTARSKPSSINQGQLSRKGE